MGLSREQLLRGVPGSAGCPHPLVDAASVAFMYRYHGAIRHVIHACAIPQHDRADVHQDVRVRILRAFRKHGAIDDRGHLSYVYQVTRRVCLSYWRTARAKRSVASEHIDATPSDAMPADEWLHRQDAHQRLHLAVATLPPLSREVMRRVLLGQTHAEIATYYGLGTATVKQAAHRARLLLRKRLVR